MQRPGAWLVCSIAFLLPAVVAAQTLPPVGSGTLVLHLKADASSVAVDASNDVLSWTAENDPSIVLTVSGGTSAGEIVFDPTGMNGAPTIVVTDTSNPYLETTLPGSVDLTDATVFWLGFYASKSGGGDYTYSIGTSGSNGRQLTHQQDGGTFEIYDGLSTFAGASIASLRNVYTVWTTEYHGGTPAASHVALADGFDLGVASSTVGYDVAPDPHPVYLFALRQRSGEQPGLDLSDGTVIQYDFVGCQFDAQWILGPTGTTVDQVINADASIFLTSQSSAGETIHGRLGSDTAPDFTGFVFGYQNRGSYYLFDWKKTTANFCGGSANAGMRLRRVQVPGGADPDGDEMWEDPSSTSITTLQSNSVPWAAGVDYEFEATHDAGQIDLVIRDGATVLESWSVADATYNTGLFGFYINSLENVRFGPAGAERIRGARERSGAPRSLGQQ
jgi:hypothetical protein